VEPQAGARTQRASARPLCRAAAGPLPKPAAVLMRLRRQAAPCRHGERHGRERADLQSERGRGNGALLEGRSGRLVLDRDYTPRQQGALCAAPGAGNCDRRCRRHLNGHFLVKTARNLRPALVLWWVRPAARTCAGADWRENPMARIIEREASPDDPIYQEPVKSYKPMDFSSFRSGTSLPPGGTDAVDPREGPQAVKPDKK